MGREGGMNPSSRFERRGARKGRLGREAHSAVSLGFLETLPIWEAERMFPWREASGELATSSGS